MTWSDEVAAIARHAGELQEAPRADAVVAMEARLRAQRKSDAAAWGDTLWSVDARDLQARAEAIWRGAYPTRPWPRGWRCRWAAIHRVQTTGGTSDSVGQCRYQRRVMLFDKPYFDRHPHHLDEVVAHELAHVITDDGHGPGFTAAFAHIAPARERTRPMPRVLRPVHAARIELRGADGAPTGPEFARLVLAAERALVRRCGPDGLSWIATWKSRQTESGRWEVYPILSKGKGPLSVVEAERRTARRGGRGA